MARIFKFKYQVLPHGGPVPNPTPVPGTDIVRSNENFGYADDVFLVSIARNSDGSIKSFLPMSTVGQPMYPPAALVEMVRDYLTHYLEKHCAKHPR